MFFSEFFIYLKIFWSIFAKRNKPLSKNNSFSSKFESRGLFIDLYYLNKNWLNKEFSLFNYYELFNNPSMKEAIDHFYATNNIEETLHNKINLYLPNKRINNHNFIISLRNVIKNYETLRTNIHRHDYVTKALIKYCCKIKLNEYKWLDYETFKKLEKEIITEEKDELKCNVVEELINLLNGLNVDDLKNENNFNDNLCKEGNIPGDKN